LAIKLIFTSHLDLALSISSTNIKMRAETNPFNLAITHQVILERWFMKPCARHGDTKVALWIVRRYCCLCHRISTDDYGRNSEMVNNVMVFQCTIATLCIGELRKSNYASALTFFHPLIRCDTTSAFSGRGKRSAWDIWNALPEITSTFAAFWTVNVFDWWNALLFYGTSKT